MGRLAIALTAALFLHILLLMAVLPGRQVVKPELKGSGYVTVSIVRHQVRTPEMIEESVSDPAQVDEERKEEVPLTQEPEEVPQPVPVPLPQKPVPVTKTALPATPIVDQPAEKKTVSKIQPEEPITGKASESVPGSPVSDEAVASSAMESLRQPEPLETVNRPPVYPPLARKRGWQGTVLLAVDVLSDGMVQSVQVKESSSYDLLDKEALRAVRKWHFSPGERDGKPVPMKVLVPVHFLLQDN